ncbi:MAG: protein translocase subunit SecF [Acidimicrobiales bacterium]
MTLTDTDLDAGAESPKTNVWSRLYHGETAINFIGRKKLWMALSLIVIFAGLISLSTRGLNFGIEFKGGTSWQVTTSQVSVTQARDAMISLGLSGATVQNIGSGGNSTLEVQVDTHLSGQAKSAKIAAVSAKLAGLAHVSPSAVSIQDVGPTWGGDITKKAVRALIFFFAAILAYITFRFEWKMAIAAIVAVVHDLLVTVGIYSLSGFQVTPATVVAVLTILGYSLYDTIVVFDRVEENTKGLAISGRLTYSDAVNLAMNQTLMRSINTTLVAILPILSVLVIGAQLLGATTLQDFGLALFIGLASGAYSSIFVASPLLAVIKEREPRYLEVRRRQTARGTASMLLTPAAAAAGGMVGGAAGNLNRSGRNVAGPGRTRIKPGSAAAGSARRTLGRTDVDANGDANGDALELETSGTSGPGPATPQRSPAQGSNRSGANRSGANRSPAGRPPPRPRKKSNRKKRR